MPSSNYLFFYDHRYALSERCLLRVEAASWDQEGPADLDLRKLGLPVADGEASARVLLIDGEEHVLRLLVSGQLESRGVDDRHLYPLPSPFFGATPFEALIHHPPSPAALLLAPSRLASFLR